MNKLINVFVGFLIIGGLITLSVHLVFNLKLSPVEIITSAFKYTSLPLGVAFKLFQWYYTEKNKILTKIDSVTELANENRATYGSIDFKLDRITSSIETRLGKIEQRDEQFDRRIVIIEQTSSLNSRLLSQQQQLAELNDRLNEVILEIQKEEPTK
jgi:hypothetical protein